MTAGPAPPSDPRELDPASAVLPAGSTLFRVYAGTFPATAFNPSYGLGGRFHFILRADSKKVPALYGAETRAAAIAESVFHDVPLRPPEGRRLSASKLHGKTLVELRSERDLELVELHHPGLGRLGLTAEEITATNPSAYPRTRAWAQALHDRGDHQGIVWMSRLFNVDRAHTFFGDRVAETAFAAVGRPLPLWEGPGLELVYELAEQLAITIVQP